MALKGGAPVLAPEIISHVIASIDISGLTYAQLAELWLVARQVSRQFLDELPKALAHKILPELAIEYNLGETPPQILNLRCASHVKGLIYARYGHRASNPL